MTPTTDEKGGTNKERSRAVPARRDNKVTPTRRDNKADNSKEKGKPKIKTRRDLWQAETTLGGLVTTKRRGRHVLKGGHNHSIH